MCDVCPSRWHFLGIDKRLYHLGMMGYLQNMWGGGGEKLERGQAARIPHTHAGNLCIFSMSCV